MASKGSDKPLLLQQFEVQGYKNLTQTLVFGPLGRINVIHGENNVGKSNLLQAIDLFFQLLGSLGSFPDADIVEAPGLVRWDYPRISNFEKWGHPVSEIFNFSEPTPIEMTGTFAFTTEQREQFGLEPSQSPIRLGVQILLQANTLGIGTMMGGVEVPVLEQILEFLATVRLLQTEQVSSRFTLLGVNRHRLGDLSVLPGLCIVPQEVRDALFDAKESREATMVRRWELFVEAMKQFGPILGPGRFDTAFDRQSNQADLVFDSGDMRVPVDLLGSGVQQIVALLGQLLMTPATLVGIEEPELNLRYTLQKQLLRAFQEITMSEYGPEQLFLTSHSPAFEAEELFFAMEMVDGAPVLSQRPRTLARVYTGTRDEEDVYPEMHARRSEPVCYVSSEGLVLLPQDVRQQLNVEHGGGLSFIPNKGTGRFEIWTVDEVERWLTGDSSDADDA